MFLMENMTNKIKSWVMAAMIFLAAVSCKSSDVVKVHSLQGESWWGISNTDGYLQPFVDYEEFDLANHSRLGHTVPFLVSSKGRYVWCDSPFTVSCKDGVFSLVYTGRAGRIESEGSLYGSLQEAFPIRRNYSS